MRTYKFELVIKEGMDEFWEELENDGIGTVQGEIIKLLEQHGWKVETLTLIEYRYTP